MITRGELQEFSQWIKEYSGIELPENYPDKFMKHKIESKKSKGRFSFKKSLCDAGADAELVEDWLKVRKLKKAANTETALKMFMSQVKVSGMGLNEVLSICIDKSWKGFKAEWMNRTNSFESKEKTTSSWADSRKKSIQNG